MSVAVSISWRSSTRHCGRGTSKFDHWLMRFQLWVRVIYVVVDDDDNDNDDEMTGQSLTV